MQKKMLKKAVKRSAEEKNVKNEEIQKKKLKKVKADVVNGADTLLNNKNKKKNKKPDEEQHETLDEKEVTENNHGKLKKSKKNVEEAPETESNTADVEIDKPIKKIDTSIFQFFTNLTQEDEEARLKAALQLTQQLHKNKDPEKHQKELDYALKRLIRGCGAATNYSRAGFFTGLVALLKTFVEEIQVSAVFDTIQKELHVGASIANKEDADAVVGKILVCGALLHAGRIQDLNSESLERVANILIQSTKYRSYHVSLGYAFLVEMIETALSAQQFEDAVWPLLHKELNKPWTKHTLQSVHCLLVVQRKYPTILNAKYLKSHFGGHELLNAESYSHLQRIFWGHSDTHIVTHPAFEAFGAYLADCRNLVEFWTETVDASIENPNKLLEFLTIKIATDILQNMKPERATLVVVELLSPNFMRMLVNGLKQIKLKKDEMLKAFYDEFMEALLTCCSNLPATANAQKVAVIRRLILYPGSFDIEKFTSTRIVHQLINTLGLDGVQEVLKMYKQIFCGTMLKQIDENNSEEWQQFERLNAGYMVQHLLAHKSVQHQSAGAYEWRLQQLKFLLICGIFHTQPTNTENNEFEPCKKEAAGSFSKAFGEQCKNMFFVSLQSKLANLSHERELLHSLVQICDKHIQNKNFKHYLRTKIGEKNEDVLQSAWNKMINAMNTNASDSVENSKKNKKQKTQKTKTDLEEDKLQLVFHILLLNMGLQLFREVEMAALAIDDLLKCMQRIQQQQQKQKKKKLAEGTEPEVEWIEVVIDLFLHLLSQNTGALRNSVNSLFPHLCGNMNVSAIHQILAVLNMQDGHNPLSRNNDEDDTEDEETQTEENEIADEDSDNDNDNDSEESDGDEEDDDDEEEEDDDEEVTETDKLRNAISQALIANGAAVNSASGNKDDDMDSVDLNDMTEEEGRRLDEALASAFKAMKKSGGQGPERKKSKSKRIETTAVMHFRIRVLDLLEIYLQHPEIYLLNHIEIMLALYNMLEHCWSDELKPLQSKVEKVLQKLTTLKPASQSVSNEVHIEDLKSEDIVNYIRQIAEQKTHSLAFDLTNKIRNRCIIYLISNATKLSKGDAQVLKLCQEYQKEFIQSRNPTVNITLLTEIYKLRWSNIWYLAKEIADEGLKMETRAFRRIQICEILSVLYRNNELQKLDISSSQKNLEKIDQNIIRYIECLIAAWSKPGSRQSHKEFQTLLDLLLHAQRTHARLNSVSPLICESETCEKIQQLRRLIRLESTHIYNRYCGTFKLSVLRNTDVITETQPMEDNEASENDSNNEETVVTEKKRKNKNLDAQKKKKQKKLERMMAASKGINGGFGRQQNGNVEENDEVESD